MNNQLDIILKVFKIIVELLYLHFIEVKFIIIFQIQM